MLMKQIIITKDCNETCKRHRKVKNAQLKGRDPLEIPRRGWKKNTRRVQKKTKLFKQRANQHRGYGY
jgi:hypothetical protein